VIEIVVDVIVIVMMMMMMMRKKKYSKRYQVEVYIQEMEIVDCYHHVQYIGRRAT